MIDEESTRKQGELYVGGKVAPCVGADVETGKLYVFKRGSAVKFRKRVYVIAREDDLLAEVEVE